jgi:hypothetical protein
MYIDKTVLVFFLVIAGVVLFFKYKTQIIRFLDSTLRPAINRSKFPANFKIDKVKLRIFSKLGLIVVILGFFMPVSCNLNGFQLAQYVSASDSFTGFALYAILLFSCLGAVLLLLLVRKIQFSVNWDWFAVIGVITAAINVFIKLNGGRTAFGENMFQSGVYVMLVGMIAALVFLIPASDKGKKKSAKSSIIPKTHTANNIKKNFCTHCGNKLLEGSNFCTNCGTKIYN